MARLLLLLALLLATVTSAEVREEVRYPVVTPGAELRFPRDHGAHPDHRIEWWYFTGWLRTGQGDPHAAPGLPVAG